MFDFKINDPEKTILIETATNGFIITRFNQYSDNTDDVYPNRTVIKANEDEYEQDFDAVAQLLWEILENMEIWNSKHFKQRIEITVEANE